MYNMNRVKKSFAVIFLIILSSGTSLCYAENQENNGDNITAENQKRAIASPLNLDALLNFARYHNPELQSAYHSWKAAEEKITQEKSLPDPKIFYGYFMGVLRNKII